jgi:hypothetical protein
MSCGQYTSTTPSIEITKFGTPEALTSLHSIWKLGFRSHLSALGIALT